MEYQHYRESVLAAVTPDEWRAHEKARMEMEDLDSMAFFGLISQADANSGKIEIATRPEMSEIYRKLGEVNPAHFINSFYSEDGVFDIGNDLTRFSISAEYTEVYNRYHNADGTAKRGWMKALNGKPTNLTERQWVQVRTPAFKNWFGDWETVAIKQRWMNVRNPEEIKNLQAQDISSFQPIKDKAEMVGPLQGVWRS